MSLVKTAVIPAAGLGTRLVPATKTIPKELIPMLARPCIEYVMEEAIEAGITEFVIIVGKNRDLMEDYFTPPAGYANLNAELAARFEGLNRILSHASVRYVQQDEPMGLGHAILCAEKCIDDDHFAVILPDDIIAQDPPCLSNLIGITTRWSGGALAVMEVSQEEVSSYGIVRAEPTGTVGTYYVRGLVEKPRQEDSPSCLAVIGRYVLPTLIFDRLRNTAPGANGEIQLTDAIATLLDDRGIYACELVGERYDVGNKLGLAKAQMRFALDDSEIGTEFREYAAAQLLV